jgi:hypothetical protein
MGWGSYEEVRIKITIDCFLCLTNTLNSFMILKILVIFIRGMLLVLGDSYASKIEY